MASPFLHRDMLSLFRGILCVRDQVKLGKEHSILKVFSALVIICFNTVHCGGRLHTDGNLTAGKLEIAAPVTEITLDFTPMTDPISTFVLVSENNQAKVVRHARNQLEVVAIHQGDVSPAQVSRLFARSAAPDLAEAMQRKNFGGNGLSRGDQFQLSFKSQESVAGECFGFIDDAPAGVRDLIKELLALQKQLKETSLAAAYLRSEPIAADRFAALRRSGKIRFTSTAEFPTDLQTILSRAVVRSRDFLALSRTQHEQLLPQASHGHEFFITANGSGYQLTLFKARDKTAHPHPKEITNVHLKVPLTLTAAFDFGSRIPDRHRCAAWNCTSR